MPVQISVCVSMGQGKDKSPCHWRSCPTGVFEVWFQTPLALPHCPKLWDRAQLSAGDRTRSAPATAALQDSKQQDAAAAAAAAAAHPKLPATPHLAAVMLSSITPSVLGPAMPICLAPLTSLQVMLCPYSRAPAGWGWSVEAQCWDLHWQLGERESDFFRRKIKVFSFEMYICN